ncbi:MAG: hypothetical protein ACJ735_14600 [Actinomycetes bacterium]
MSESAFPVPAQGVSQNAPVDEPPAENRRRLIIMVAGAAALLVLVAAAYFLFLKGGSSDNNASGPVVPHHAASAAASKKGAVTKTLPSTFNNVLSRDPFKPLIAPPPPPPAPAPPSAAAGASSGAAGTAAPTATSANASQAVTLVKVYSKAGKTYAQTRVGNTVYSPAVGQNFGGTFQLLAVHGTAATFVQGDEQFSLSIGQVALR